MDKSNPHRALYDCYRQKQVYDSVCMILTNIKEIDLHVNYMKIGEKICGQRKKLGFSQNELLDELCYLNKPHFGRNTLSKLENGDPEAFKAINMGQWIALCELFECSVGQLLGEYQL